MKRRILIVEDDPALVETLTDRLKSEGYAVRVSTNGDAALKDAYSAAFDLILLDLLLPGRNGLEICTELRRRRIDTPILMLTARGDVTDRVVGLRLGWLRRTDLAVGREDPGLRRRDSHLDSEHPLGWCAQHFDEGNRWPGPQDQNTVVEYVLDDTAQPASRR